MDIMLQQLFGAIIENIIPLVLIGGVILNIFKRFKEGASGQNQQQRRPEVQADETDRRTETNPFETMFEELDRKGREIFEQMDRKTESKPVKTNRTEETLANLRTEREVSVPIRTEMKKVSEIAPQKQQQKKPSLGTLKGISRKRAVEGVIWAEILGPPRSRRPHATYNQFNSRR
jgi:hypothetical protein